ncbi:MAG: helix-turn-helix domain-containing protein [Clostridia bacterium]|nr:helix-turn-helix domain-containing protein [Clostridia bacterium]
MFKAFIVDDDKYSAEATYRMFPWEELNITRVDKIYNPVGLTERILNEKPHVVFIDIEMGAVSGLDIIQKCNEHNSTSLFVIISGHDNFNYAHTAVNLGAIYYLLKPIDLADVENVTNKLKKLLTNDDIAILEHEPPKDLWDKIVDFIKKNYMKKIQAQDICSELYISSTTFYNAFKANSGETFIEYLTHYRLEKAMLLLRSSSKSIHEVAEAVGIKDHYYFSKIFKKYTGMTALEYKNKEATKSDAAQI